MPKPPQKRLEELKSSTFDSLRFALYDCQRSNEDLGVAVGELTDAVSELVDVIGDLTEKIESLPEKSGETA